MKKFINSTNTFLLENYPNIWNVRFLWMLIIGGFIHLLFFFFGYFTLNSPELLHEYGAKNIFFENGTVFLNIILFLIFNVIWLIFLFKNNAFKSFYPVKTWEIFAQLVMYMIIIFFTSTYYISYNYGLKTYINLNYDDTRISEEIELSNKAAIFFSQDVNHYTINQRRYPPPFDTLYCETYMGSNTHIHLEGRHRNSIKDKPDSLKPYLQFLDYKYYFFTLKSKIGKTNIPYRNTHHEGFVFSTPLTDSTATYYYKDSIVDILKYEISGYPSYYNYSKVFYSNVSGFSNPYAPYTYDIENNQFSDANSLMNKQVYEILKKNNPNEIKAILKEFLTICDAYHITYNLNSDVWFDLVNHSPEFKLQALIRNGPKELLGYAMDDVGSNMEDFNEEHLTDFYIQHSNLHHLFQNVDEIKLSKPFSESIHFYLWFSFFLAGLIFAFRITGLRASLFTLITIMVLSITIALLTALFEHSVSRNNYLTKYFVSYLSVVLIILISLIPLFFRERLKKIVVAVSLNISYLSFALLLFLILLIISAHQDDICKMNHDHPSWYNHHNILEELGILWSYILFILNLIFLYFYAYIIKKWKGLPEG